MLGLLCGLIGVVFILVLLGALYTWIAGVIANVELSIFRGTLIVFASGVVASLAEYLIPIPYAGTPIQLASMMMMGMGLADLEWKPALIISAIYAVIGFVLTLVFVLLLA